MGERLAANLRLPKHWPRLVRSAVVHAVSLANTAFAVSQHRIECHRDGRVGLRAEVDRLCHEVALLTEELRIKDARMARLPAQRRPNYPPIERLAILELRAARGWSQVQTARRLLVTPLTVASWTQRLDDDGPDALVQVREPVNRFPELVSYLVQRLKGPVPEDGNATDRARSRACGSSSGHDHRTSHAEARPQINSQVRPFCEAKNGNSKTPKPRLASRPDHGPDDRRILDLEKPLSLPQRWPFCWWVAVVVDHFSRRAMGAAHFKNEPTAREVTNFLGRACRRIKCWPAHLITDHGPQFTAEEFDVWCRRHGIQQRFGAIGKYGSLAVIERYIRSLKNECTRLLPIVPLARTAFGRELDHYVAWYNAERPHTRFGARTPDEIYFGTFPACRRPRFEPRERWPRRSPCAGPHALVRGRPGAVVELCAEHRAGRKHLPVVSLKRVA